MECVSNSWAPAPQSYIDLFSLAQGDGDAHQECKWHEGSCFAFSRASFFQLRKTRTYLSGCICRLDSRPGRDFHGFLWISPFAMWIWLESSGSLVRSVFFFTPSSDLRPSSSQPVHGKSPVSIAVGTISEASTGIGYYYCIYIDICIYILRRSKRQAFHRKAGVVHISQTPFQVASLVSMKMRGEPV